MKWLIPWSTLASALEEFVRVELSIFYMILVHIQVRGGMGWTGWALWHHVLAEASHVCFSIKLKRTHDLRDLPCPCPVIIFLRMLCCPLASSACLANLICSYLFEVDLSRIDLYYLHLLEIDILKIDYLVRHVWNGFPYLGTSKGS